MMHKELLEILACPETKDPLFEANDSLIAAINRQIGAGKLVTANGATVTGKIQHGLVRSDGKVLYPVVDDIPILLPDEGIVVPEGVA